MFVTPPRRLAPLWPSLALTLASVQVAAAADSHVYAARTPTGTIRVLTLVAGSWPAGGLRIEDENGAVLVAHVEPDVQAARALDGPSQTALAAMSESFDATQPNGQAAAAIRVLSVMTDWSLARAAGAGIELSADLHPKRVRVLLLGAGGDVQRTLDPVEVISDPGPPAPLELQADTGPRGVELHWHADPHAAVPFVGYLLDRDDGAGFVSVVSHAQLLARDPDGKLLPILDRNPPVDVTVRYAIRLIDALGVAGAPANVEVFSSDFEAGAPPAALKAVGGRGVVTLNWQAPASPRTRALVVERAQLLSGPYERLTPDGLPAQTLQFVDQHVMPGGVYYYRVRSITASGALGSAPDAVRARPLAANPPAAPANLKAIVGSATVELTWQPVLGVDVAGYIVERRMDANAPRWARLNQRIAAQTKYLDSLGPSGGGACDYRVTAVSTDEGLGLPSAPLHVSLVDSQPPGAPVILSASGEDGRAQIGFAPAEPAARTAQVALVRADSPLEAGLVVGSPTSAAGGSMTDTWVRPGQVYWYRLVAFDSAGNRGQESAAIEVRVRSPTLEAPAPPKAQYVADANPRVSFTFAAPPPHVRTLIEVQRKDGGWSKVLGPLTGTEAVDHAPMGTHPTYRLLYVSEAGGIGVPSAPVTVRTGQP